MEFEKHGPLAQSKEMAENQKNGWVPMVIMLGLGIIVGVTYVNILQDNQPWNKINKGATRKV